ncbi:MAG: GNAT family N-acetyltransferase [Myxococcales bacterium]|nr:GNAT family N-acetyltransferase [Myxococcales bacterium]HIK83554.1 GNAT family N-acetyltransferase [Myxococcales bacterium]
MEIRTLKAQETVTLAGMLDGWRLAEGWTAGDRFRKQVEFDPTWLVENVFVAVEQGQILSAVSILPRHLKILRHSIPTGGLSNLYTDPASRGRGIATELLERACDTMRSRGLELAMIFPGPPPATPEFFDKRGWHCWGGQQTILRRDRDASESAATRRKGSTASGDSEAIELAPIHCEDERELQSVKSIHAAYGASRSGTVVRDDATWRSCLQLTPAPREEFWVARRGGLIVAYARASIIEDVLTITELGRFQDGASALAILVASLLVPRDDDALIKGAAVGRLESEQLRSFLVLPTFDDIGLTVALEHREIRSHPMDDARASFRCVNLIGIASRLDVDLLRDEDGRAFLSRILPPDAMVFWPVDRF